MIKYDNLLVIICVFLTIIEVLACFFKLPKFIVYAIPIILFLIGIYMIIMIIIQNKKKRSKKTKQNKKEDDEIIDIL